MESDACNKNTALIIMHIDSQKFFTLVTKLANHNFKIFVHVDKKSSIDLDSLKDKYPQATFLSDYEVYWGGANMLRVMIALLRLGLQCQKCGNFFFLSGEDSVNDAVSIPDPRNVIRRVRREVPVTFLRRKVSLRRFFGKWDLDTVETNQKVPRNVLGQACVRLRNSLFACFRQNINPPFALLLKSSQWIFLDREDAELCVKAYENEKINKFFTSFPVPDEWFFYTILNYLIPGKYDFVVGSDELPLLTYEYHAINWTTRKDHPEAISQQTFRQSNCYFGRKISDFDSRSTPIHSMIFLDPQTYRRSRAQISKIQQQTVFSHDSEIMYRLSQLFRFCEGYKTELSLQQQTKNLMNLCVRASTKITIISENKHLQLAAQQTLEETNLNLRVTNYLSLSNLGVSETNRKLNDQQLVIMLVSNHDYVNAYSNHINLLETPVFVMSENLFKSSIESLDSRDLMVPLVLRKSWIHSLRVTFNAIIGITLFVLDGARICAHPRL